MSIEKNEPTEDSVETTESNTAELTAEEAEGTAGGLKQVWDGGEGRHGEGEHGGEHKREIKYV